MNKKAIVTGATSGIGEATSEALASLGYDVIITGRRQERLYEIQKRLEDKYGIEVLTLCFDVRNQSEVESTFNELPAAWTEIEVLINNAGLAVGLNHIQDGLVEDWERMIDTNVKGLLYVTRSIAPLMIARKRGHIINIASTAGKEVYENGNVYCATKHAVDALSKAMRVDMLKDNIKVTNIAPGAVETEFSLVRFKEDAERASNTYNGYQPLKGEDIANVIKFVVTLPDHVCINDLVITPTAQANATNIFRR